MKHAVTKFKSLKIALKELEPFVRDGNHLKSGKPFKRFNQARSRELLVNWLICVAINKFCRAERLDFTSDPTGGDGIINDTVTGETWSTEHVIALKGGKSTGADLILNAIKKKVAKGGAAYAEGKTLVVFAEGVGAWTPRTVSARLPDPLLFDAVWVAGLQGVVDGRYIYDVCRLTTPSSPFFKATITINADFEGWSVAVEGKVY